MSPITGPQMPAQQTTVSVATLPRVVLTPLTPAPHDLEPGNLGVREEIQRSHLFGLPHHLRGGVYGSSDEAGTGGPHRAPDRRYVEEREEVLRLSRTDHLGVDAP